jgi:hypothetical protein
VGRYRVTVTELVDALPPWSWMPPGLGSTLPWAIWTTAASAASAAFGGPAHLLADLTQLIADHPTGRHDPTR